MKRSEKIFAFCEKYIRVPEGDLVGQPLELMEFQKQFIRDVYDNPHGTGQAILSLGRKNGKTSIMAVLILAHLVGPEAKLNSQLVCGAMSREQASLVFNLACKMREQNETLSKIVHPIPSKKILQGLPMGTEFRALAADGKTAQGGSIAFGLIDECGQVIGPTSDFISAIETGCGAHKNALLMYISTQASNDTDFFSLLIDDAINSGDKKIVCHIHQADKDGATSDEKQWQKANPALGVFRSYEDVKQAAIKASRMPSFENQFRNKFLNQRVAMSNPFISRDAWAGCSGELIPLEECDVVYGGLDLSSKKDLTALVLYGFHALTNTWHAHTYAWTPSDNLIERAKLDRAPYDVWVKQGLLFTTEGKTVSYDFVAQTLAELVKDINLVALGYDRWRMDLLQKEMERISLALPMLEIGMGFKDMAPAVEALEEKILNRTLRHGNHPVLTMACANTVVSKNPTGDRKPDKMKTSGRIDPFVALLIAEACAGKKHEEGVDLDAVLNNPLVF